MKNDLVVFGVVTTVIATRFIPPVFETKDSAFHFLQQGGRYEWAFGISVQDAQESTHAEIGAIVVRADEIDGFFN